MTTPQPRTKLREAIYVLFIFILILLVLHLFPSVCEVVWKYDGTVHRLQVCGTM